MRLRSLTILVLAVFAVATLLTGLATYSAAHRAIERLVDRRIDGISDAILSGVPEGDRRVLLARIDAFSRQRDSGDIGFELEDGRGQRLGGNVVLDRRVPMGFSTLHRADGIAGLSHGRVQMRDAGGGLRLITIAETEPIEGYDAARVRNYALGFGLIALIVLAGTATFGLLVRRRIGEVRATAEAIIDGDMTRRVPVAGHGGVFDAQATTFNRMLDRIDTLVASLRGVGSDIAHDLRTPLTRLRGRLAHLAETTPGDEIDAVIDQCDDLLATFAAILRIAEIDGGDRRASFAPVDLSDVAAEVVDALSEAAGESGHRLALGATRAAVVQGDRASIVQAVFNLVENALTHTPPESRITVSVDRQGAQAMLTVTDDGPGIAPDDRSTALRRFGRIDASRHTPGHGLGLPLVEAVARMHRGTLTLADAAPGLAATLALPLSA